MTNYSPQRRHDQYIKFNQQNKKGTGRWPSANTILHGKQAHGQCPHCKRADQRLWQRVDGFTACEDCLFYGIANNPQKSKQATNAIKRLGHAWLPTGKKHATNI